ncbi:MAG: metal-dependent transcriptional regulator [Planctomycetota bacterium]
MPTQANLSAPLEDYLETIFDLVERHGGARPRDIARRLEVHKSTVTAAVKALDEKGLVDYRPYEAVKLTDRGRAVASRISRRHETLQRFLQDVLGLDAERAEDDACRMEHGLDPRVTRRLVWLVDYIERDPDWQRRWKRYLGRRKKSFAASSR